MRMEAGGGAQSCYIEQVTPLSDQKTETLLGQQLQRWGREMLYEESMAITSKILQLLHFVSVHLVDFRLTDLRLQFSIVLTGWLEKQFYFHLH